MSAAKRDGPSNSVRSPAAPVRFDRFELDEANASFLCDGKAMPLAPTPFAVLCALVRQPGSLLTKQTLLDEIWGHQFVSESVLKTVISDLRTLLDDDARQPRFIETVSRRGYRFIATTVTTTQHPEAGARKVATLQAMPLVGRREALSQLHAIWDHALAGKRSIVWVAGEPGIGKTTLIEHFIASLADTICIRGQCVEQHGGGEPYLPVLEALGELCRRDGAAAPLLRAVAPTWLLQLPWLSSADERDALRRELAGVGADRALREMGEFLDRYTEQRPLLLVTEDLHWSDRATIQLIDYIARRRGSARLMWLASFRLAEVVALNHPLNPLRRELRLHGLCDEIVLDPFSGAEVAEYLAQRAPSIPVDEAFVRALQERTDGLPLFVASVVRELAARPAQSSKDPAPATQIARMAVPENLAAIIDRYIARLGDEQRIMLSAAAVCGVEFRISTVADAAGREIAWVGQTCDELQQEGFWLAAPGRDENDAALESTYSFRHALFRQVLYERTTPFRRAQLHLNVGMALERERAASSIVAAAELAAHFERGREPMKALQYFAEAAEAALLHFSPAECKELAEHGLGLLDRAPGSMDRIALEISLATLNGVATSHLLGFSSNDAKSALVRAHALLGEAPQHRMRGLLVHSLSLALLTRAEYAEAIDMAERSDVLATSNDDPVLRLGVCIVQGDVQMLQGEPRQSRSWFERGLSAIASLKASSENLFLDDPHVTTLVLLAVQLLHLGLVESGRRRLHEAHALMREGVQPMAQMIAVWFEAVFELRLGNAERVAELAQQGETLVDEFALAQGRTAFRWFRGWANAHLGQPHEGYALIREAYEENTRLGMLSGASETLGYAAEALLLAGDLDGARRELDQALHISEKFGETIYLPQLLLTEAAIARGQGNSRGATDSVKRAIAEARQQGAAWFELLAMMELIEHSDATSEDQQSFAALVSQLPEASDTVAFSRAQALLQLCAQT
jgi:DNA-binding winged helix-turn-helix (wHTH) protein/tetratricopeptide (TPR) repeat protein